MRTPEGRAEVEALAREMRAEDLAEAIGVAMTTEGITMEQVRAAMEYLGMHNPRPEIPLETTVSGHEIVAVARRLRDLEARVKGLESAVRLVIDDATARAPR